MEGLRICVHCKDIQDGCCNSLGCEESPILPVRYPTACITHFIEANRWWKRGTTCGLCGNWSSVQETRMLATPFCASLFVCFQCLLDEVQQHLFFPVHLRLVVCEYVREKNKPSLCAVVTPVVTPVPPKNLCACSRGEKVIPRTTPSRCEACEWERNCVNCRELSPSENGLCYFCVQGSQSKCTWSRCMKPSTRPSRRPKQCLTHFLVANKYWETGSTCCFCGEWTFTQCIPAYIRQKKLFACVACAIRYTHKHSPLPLDLWKFVWQFVWK